MTEEERIERVMRKQLGKRGWNFSDAADWRQTGKVKIAMPGLLNLLALGMIQGRETLRDVESLGSKLGGWLLDLVPSAPSDTTLDAVARRLDPVYLNCKLSQQVRDAHRSKILTPRGVSAGVATIDGKNLATLSHDADGTGHERSKDNEKWHDPKRAADAKYFLMPALRATLSSAASTPCISQMPIPPGSAEATVFPAFVDELQREYGRTGMIEVIDADAGLCSLSNANHVHQEGYIYVFGLKGNQAALHEAAQLVLYHRMQDYAPDAETQWERREGKLIRRLLWRSAELSDFENSVGTWDHLRQVWLVRQETEHPDGRVEAEDRFFVTSAPWRRFTPSEILALVRLHWVVENDAFNSLDMQWAEDSAPWCTMGSAIWGLGVLRLMAYNFVQYVRKRRLHRRRPDGTFPALRAWRQVFELIHDTFTFVRYVGAAAAPT